MDEKCYECEKSVEQIRLGKCPICFRYFCHEHAYHMSGRPFCSSGCAQHFFFAEDEDEE